MGKGQGKSSSNKAINQNRQEVALAWYAKCESWLLHAQKTGWNSSFFESALNVCLEKLDTVREILVRSSTE